MAHKISSQHGRHEIAFANETPWHGLGTRVDRLQTAQEILEPAGMTWTVGMEPVIVRAVPVDGYKAIVRQDTAVVLGITSDRYQPIQNTQAADVMDALVTEGGAHIEVAGVLDQGERCWMLAHIPGDFEVLRNDLVKPYMLLAWGHDGKHGLAGKLTPVRVVCHNTLTAAGLGSGRWSQSADIYIKHTRSAKIKIEEARRALGIAKRQVEKTVEAYQALAKTAIADTDVLAYFEATFAKPERPEGDDDGYAERLARWEAHQEQLLNIYRAGEGTAITGVRGSAWGAYNAVTEWADHHYPVLGDGKTISPVRTQSVLFGGYSAIKAQAFTNALALVK